MLLVVGCVGVGYGGVLAVSHVHGYYYSSLCGSGYLCVVNLDVVEDVVSSPAAVSVW